MNKKVYNLLRALLALVFLISVGAIVRDILDYQAGSRTYETAAQTAGLIRRPNPKPAAANPSEPAVSPEDSEWEPEPDPDPLDALREVNLAALREINPEVVGWIEIPDTGISYPLMQGANNQWYLKHTWVGDGSSVGSVFMDCGNSWDLSDFHTIIYGHRLRSGAMFAPLRFYDSLEYWQEHPYIYIADDAGLHRYDIFAAHAVGVEEIVYQGNLSTEAEQEAFIRFCLEGSTIDTGIVPEVGSRIVTLSTCTGDGYSKRWVVQGVLHQEAEEPEQLEEAVAPDNE